MTTETIPADVSDTDATAAAELQKEEQAQAEQERLEREEAELDTHMSDRDRKMAEVKEARALEMAENVAAAAEINGPHTNGPANEIDDDEVVNVAPVLPDDDRWKMNDQGQRVRSLMVNGQPVELSEDDYERHLQKDLAGDAKLRHAAEWEARLREQEAELSQRQNSRQEQGGNLPGEPDDERAALLELATTYQDQLLEGDTEEAAASLVDAMLAVKGRSDPTLTPDELAEQTSQRVMERMNQQEIEKDVQTGWDAFQNDYPKIAESETLTAAADVHRARLIEKHPDWLFSKVIAEAGRLTTEEFGLNPPATTDEDRLARKAKLTPMPRAQQTRTHVQEKAPVKDLSPAATVERMKAGRAGG